MTTSSSLPVDVTRRFLAEVQPVDEGSLYSLNVLWVSARDNAEFFGGVGKARISDRVWEVRTADWILPGHVGMSKAQREEVSEAISKEGQVLISPFESTEENTREVSQACFAIHVPGELEPEKQGNFERRTLIAGDLEQRVRSFAEQRLFKMGQTVSFVYRGQALRASYVIGYSKSDLAEDDAFDSINPATDILFKTFSKSPLRIVEERLPTEPHTLQFTLTVDEKEFNPLVAPALISQPEVERALRRQIGEDLVTLNDSFLITLPEGCKALAHLKGIDDPEKAPSGKGSLERGYRLNSQTLFDLQSTSSLVAISDGEPTPLKSVKLGIVNIERNDGYDGVQEKEVNWIDLEALRAAIRRDIAFCGRSLCKVHYGMYVLTLNVVNIPLDTVLDKHHRTVKAWKLTPETEIDFALKPGLGKILVPSENVYPLSSLKLFISPVNNSVTTGAFTVDKAQIIALMRERSIPWSMKQEFELELDKDHKISVRVDGMQFLDPRRNATIYPYLGLIDETTRWEFNSNERFIRFASEESRTKVDFKNLKAALEQQVGLTGVSDSVMDVVKALVYPLTGMRRWAELTGVKPPKGLLLYGAPGTGKTTLARGIQKLLGIPDDNLVMVSAPALLDKYVGESEANIRALFQPAKAAPEELHMIVIDEIDALVGKRSNATSSFNKNLPTQLLAEMDGLKELSNVIVIGTTNRLEDVDEAFLRDGRFSHQVFFPKPDAAQRRAILEFHVRDFKAKALLAEDVDLDHYAREMEGASGDNMRGLVNKAVLASFNRLAELGLSDEDYPTHREAKIRHADFMIALERYKKTLKGDDQGPPPGMFL